IMWWGLLTVCLVGLFVVIGGVLEALGVNDLRFLHSLFRVWPTIPVGVLLVSICATFDLPTRVLMGVWKVRNETILFDPGYVNARWQLDDSEEVTAMNYDLNNCSILGVAVMNLMIAEDNVP